MLREPLKFPMSSFGQGISLSLEIYLFLTPMVLTQLFKLKVAKDAYLLAKAPPDLRNPDTILRGSCHRGAAHSIILDKDARTKISKS